LNREDKEVQEFTKQSLELTDQILVPGVQSPRAESRSGTSTAKHSPSKMEAESRMN
jgi:hypothetical protein